MLEDLPYPERGASSTELRACSMTRGRAVAPCQQSRAPKETCISLGPEATLGETAVCRVGRAGFHATPLFEFPLDCMRLVGRKEHGRGR